MSENTPTAQERGIARYDMPAQMRDDVRLLAGLLGAIIKEAGGQDLLDDVERLRQMTIRGYGDPDGLAEAAAFVDTLSLNRAEQVARAFTCYFHLVNLAEEFHRVRSLRRGEVESSGSDVIIEESIPRAFTALADEVGREDAIEALKNIEFRPVLTAHPTEARRRGVSRALRRISDLLDERDILHPASTALAENTRHLLAEIDVLWLTAPLRVTKPTPIDEVKSALDVFESTLFHTFPSVYRRVDDWLLGDDAGRKQPLAEPFVRLGSWIGGDRDGNPNVLPETTRQAATMMSDTVLIALEKEARTLARKLTVAADDTPASPELTNLWNKQRQMSAEAWARADVQAPKEPHRGVLTMIAERIGATRHRDADLAYANAEQLEADLRIVQDSLVKAGAPRLAYGTLQKLIWQVQTFGFHLAELEIRQHSQVHEEALADIAAHGVDSPDLADRTKEVLDTFRSLGWVQRRFGIRAARRFIVSFTQKPEHLAAVYQLAELAFPDPDDRPIIDAIPLFETFADLEAAIDILEATILLPQVQARLAANGRKIEVMLGYSDSSKDVGPVAATLALHSAQSRIAKWAQSHGLELTLFHGRGGSLGRGGGPANRALLAQPPRSVDGRFKLTEQGEVILARYGDKEIATRHIEQVAAATLLASSPSLEFRNAVAKERFTDLAAALDASSRERFHSLVRTEGFPAWFAQVTPLEEIGLLAIGSRPAKRGLSVNSLDDLRAIPWVFSWAQARINLAGWFGLGTALRDFAQSRPDGFEQLQVAYQEWPLLNTLIENVEMSIAKTDERIARLYLALGDRDDLANQVLEELALTRKWVLAITGNTWPLERRRVLGRAVQLRSPYIDALSLLQVRALRGLRHSPVESPTPVEPLDSTNDAAAQRTRWQHLLLLTVHGVSAGLQN
ncbi:MAG: phosphoenolpyruvate carboxylase, partial [Promicromonosporaceae bacterium]|nr:phosphoenolpyruvate carboxylase [Promicromonosporaceae bacterium]